MPKAEDKKDTTIQVNKPVEIQLKATDPKRELTFVEVTDPVNVGTVSGFPSGKVTYSPKKDYEGDLAGGNLEDVFGCLTVS